MAVVLTTSVSAMAQQGLPTEKVLPLALAQQIVAGAIDACKQQGYNVSASVVDRGGTMRAFGRADGAGPHTVNSAFRKAFTAGSLRAPTAQVAENVAKAATNEGLRNMDDRILILAGGLPIRAGNEVVGGVGVGGAPGGDKDEACAKAALDKVSSELK
jgi:uncharacterized protein GlcG (DUF336 family)